MCHDSRYKVSCLFMLCSEIDSGVHFCPDILNCGEPLKIPTVPSAGLSSPSFIHSSDMRDDLSSTLCLIHCTYHVEIDQIQPEKWNRVNSLSDEKCKQCCWAMQTNEHNHQPASSWQTFLFFLSGHRPWTNRREMLITLSWRLIRAVRMSSDCRGLILCFQHFHFIFSIDFSSLQHAAC